MLDIKFIRENKDLVQAGAKKKRLDFDVEELLKIDDERKAILMSVEKKRSEQNLVGQKIAVDTDLNEKQKNLDLMKSLKVELEKEEDNLKELMKKWQSFMVRVPNIPDISVPDGESDKDNKEIRTWGNKPVFDFKAKDYISLMEDNKMLDLERGTKVAGFRGYILKNTGAMINFAIWQLALEHFVKRGFEPMLVPSLVRKETLLGTGYIPQGEEDLYKTQDNDYLAGTGEVATMSYYSGEVLEEKDLPKKFLSFSDCFRREAGSHGKDTKGIIRVHEFYKFEQVVLCEASHEVSVKLHEELTKNSEEFLQVLNIPYRVVVNCGGDLGLGQVKKYDIEAWLPSSERYLETHSSSYFHDFQTRRLNIKYKSSDGKLKFVHSLNNTAVATPRILAAIVENHQQSDGSIKIPEALKKYIPQ